MAENDTKAESDKAPAKPDSGGLGDIVKLLGSIEDKDARVGLVLSVFTLLVLVVMWFAIKYVGAGFEGGFPAVLRSFFTLLVGAVLFLAFFKAIDGSILPRVLLWFATGLALLTVSAFWLQAILRDPVPFLIEARCFANPWGVACPFGEPAATTLESASAEPDRSVTTAAAGGQGDQPNTGMPACPDPRNLVCVQFAGSLRREEVAAVSTALHDEGWNIPEWTRGGERTVKAIGIDEVRYFHKEDRDLALSLAQGFNAKAAWIGFDTLGIAFVDGYQGRVKPGQLEVWTSVD